MPKSSLQHAVDFRDLGRRVEYELSSSSKKFVSGRVSAGIRLDPETNTLRVERDTDDGSVKATIRQSLHEEDVVEALRLIPAEVWRELLSEIL